MGRFQDRINELEAENARLREELSRRPLPEQPLAGEKLQITSGTRFPDPVIGPDVPAFQELIRETVEETLRQLNEQTLRQIDIGAIAEPYAASRPAPAPDV